MTVLKNDDFAKQELSTRELETVAAGFSWPFGGGHGPVVLPPRFPFNGPFGGGHGPVVLPHVPFHPVMH
jgi:hypothetical protein